MPRDPDNIEIFETEEALADLYEHNLITYQEYQERLLDLQYDCRDW